MSNNNRNKRSNKNRSRKPRPKRRRARFNDSRLQITNIENKPIMTRSIRYQSILTGTGTLQFQNTDLLLMFGHVTSGATTFYPLYECVKINSISISAYQTTGAIESVGFKWESPNAPEVLETLITQSAVMARAVFTPPEDSSASWWFNNNTSAFGVFSIIPSATTLDIIMDINFRCVINDGAQTSTPLSVASSFTGMGARVLRTFYPVSLNQVV